MRILPAAALAAAITAAAPLVAPSSHAQAQSHEALTRAEAGTGGSLLPGDVVRVQIWREEDLSGEFQVDAQGGVVLPLLGPKVVVGISADQLREDLTQAYQQYLVNTAVNVTLLRRVVVLGEVRVPGQYTIDATNSVADVIARAQGVTADGNAEDIVLVRDNRRLRTGLIGAVSLQEAGIRSGDQIIVGKRSWFSRNFSSVVGIASLFANLYLIAFK